MRYLVYGAGAVGSLIGGTLARSGLEVGFLVRPPRAQLLKARGLTIAHQGESFNLGRAPIITDVGQLEGTFQPELVLLTVKAYDCSGAAADLKRLPGSVPVVSFLNGVGSEAILKAALGSGRVIAATLTSSVRVTGALVILERSRGVGIVTGHPAADRLAADLTRADVRVRRYANADSMKWSKLAINLLGNASSAILGWPVDRIFANRALYRLEHEALREALKVMRALGHPVVSLPGVPMRLLATLVHLPAWLVRPLIGGRVAGGRGEKMPSFYYDLEHGRSELDWLHGAVLRSAHELGVHAPANQTLFDTLSLLLAEPAQRPEFAGRPAELIRRAAANGVPGMPRV